MLLVYVITTKPQYIHNREKLYFLNCLMAQQHRKMNKNRQPQHHERAKHDRGRFLNLDNNNDTAILRATENLLSLISVLVYVSFHAHLTFIASH